MIYVWPLVTIYNLSYNGQGIVFVREKVSQGYQRNMSQQYLQCYIKGVGLGSEVERTCKIKGDKNKNLKSGGDFCRLNYTLVL